ncbi:hypothetical protein K456DRAFT_1876229 [Colletotrichum gloeosporioides 23]|nr:hypothetical protein K456DRAFT_1876229 [Colletotrichum gloeosporioides 23]
MEIQDQDVRLFLDEVERQLGKYGRGGVAKLKAELPRRTTREDSWYLSCLDTLKVHASAYLLRTTSQVQEPLSMSNGNLLLDHTAPPDMCFLWKFMTFSAPPGEFNSHLKTRSNLKDYFDIYTRSGSQNDCYTDDIWGDKHIEKWITSEQPSQIFLATVSPRCSRLQGFALELIRHLEKHQPIIHVLGGPHYSPVLPSEKILEKLAYQSLYHVSIRNALPVILHIFSSMREAKDCESWFGVLRIIFQTIPKLSVVLDLAILQQSHIFAIQDWPDQFEKIKSASQASSGAYMQLMSMGPRQLLKMVGPQWQNIPKTFIEDYVQAASVSNVLNRKRPVPKAIEVPTAYTERNVASIPHASRAEISTRSSSSLRSDSTISIPSTSRSLPDCAKTIKSTSEDADAATSRRREKRRTASPQSHPRKRSRRSGSERSRSSQDYDTVHTEPSAIPGNIRLLIVCALTLESDAVEALFDRVWDLDHSTMKSPRDTNTYTFGIFSKLPAVLVHMPGMGQKNASLVAMNCFHSFVNIRLALVVGICGSVPFYDKEQREILLGDIIISDSLVQYDYGRQYPDEVQRKSSINDGPGKLPIQIQGLLNMLKGRKGSERLRKRTMMHLELLKQELGTQAEYVGAEHDELFDGAYIHRHNDSNVCLTCSDNNVCNTARSPSCEDLFCDKGKLVPRKRLKKDAMAPEPVIHIGPIACGDKVMKSGQHRDEIGSKEGVIAFEMEGAGVWDIFPCLVIKAVCDYADSHKQKRWQKYAAATASACAKGILTDVY